MSKTKVKKEVTKFSKNQLVNSSKFKHNRDLISELLDEDKSYTIEEVESLIKKYMKGKVN